MTDLRSADIVRESLETVSATAYAAGVARETLLLDPNLNNAHVAGVYREALLQEASRRLNMSQLECLSLGGTVADTSLTLRWSDDGGASWSSALTRSMGTIGQYETNIQFRRLGYARSRVVELSWAGGEVTALTGVFIEYQVSAT